MHMQNMEELEGLFEKRLVLEQERYKQLQEDKQDEKFVMEEKMAVAKEEQQEELDRMEAALKDRLVVEESRILHIQAKSKQSEHYYNEVLMPAEGEIEDQAEKVKLRIAEIDRENERAIMNFKT
eukprot:TRINITY_DN35633_c0_g1_i2.p3 TRINITY_DN35633_c0_g1~~TRINITY_DN35633_c0_g1_i2.p3  ORF type:complete len:143 (+),score=35.31 TRINITY_DN35633_c0_g1_i2:59-430(+)